ncbi:MAG TPA: TonB-dependent receptor [Gammaproteobacteria bacterium]|nr:TonB-dependent receptor [Gammaproteobacteria bacterium]
MKRFNRRSVLGALVLSFALGAMGVSTGAWAANRTSGGMYGEATAGATITATNQAGLTRTATVGNDGHFTFVALPPGTYTVQEMEDGNVVASRTVQVQINTSAHVSFVGGAQQLGTIQVVGGAINPIDVTTSNTSLVISSQQFKQLPVARNQTDVALLAPTTLQSSPTLGVETNSFGGASAAENAYFLNGLNVTDSLNFVNFAQPPFEALETFQVKTGGLNAAYGAALGGILNVVTKSGTNTFHAGANIFWRPRGLHASSPDSVIRVLDDPTTKDVDEGQYLQYYARRSDDNQNHFRYNVYGSGPIIKDHLFFYALYQGTKDVTDDYSSTLYTRGQSNSPQGLAKIDWQINDANLLELTAFNAKEEDDYDQYDLVVPNSNWADASTDAPYNNNVGSSAYIGKYTLTPTADFNISALWGYVRFDHGQSSPTINCPAAYDERSGTAIQIGCFAHQVYAGTTDFDARHQLRIDGEWQIGNHDVTFGYDKEAFFGNVHTHYSGPMPPGPTLAGQAGYTWIYFPPTKDCKIASGDPIPGCSDYVRRRVFVDAASFNTYTRAIYLQDNWRIGNFYFRYGARAMSYENDNPAGEAYIDVNNKIAPRLGLSWDVFGDSSLKVYANAGRYYIAPSGDSNVRLAGAELDYYQYYTFTGIDQATGEPIGAKQFGPMPVEYENGAMGQLNNVESVVASNIKPMYEDEYIIGAQQRISGTQWSLGIRAIRRNLKAGMDDVCTFPYPSFGAVQYVAQKSGETPEDVSASLPGCILLNPGYDASIGVTFPDGKSGTYDIPASAIGVPKATRYYNAVEFLFERAFDGKWFLNGSLTWSHNYGNEEGYVLSDIGQVDAGLTEAFDFPGLTEGATGDLPNDRRWVLKVFGAYNFTPEWQLGLNFHYSSGGPLSCFGLKDAALGGFAHYYGNDSHYCHLNGAPPQLAVVVPRGSMGRGPRNYSLDLAIHYMPSWAPGLRLGVSVVNVFNFQNPSLLNQTYENSDGVPLPSWLAPYAYQQPQYFRFSVEYDFL